jgi:hypothetical protein
MTNEAEKSDYKRYAKHSGHQPGCAWVIWVVQGKHYPNPGCTCGKEKPRKTDTEEGK